MKQNIISILQRIEEEKLRRRLKSIKAEDKEIRAIRKALQDAGVHTSGLLTFR